MNRVLTLLAGPELVLGVFTAAVFAFCARHHSYSDEDVRLLEKLLLLLPLLVVPVGFITVLVPGAKTWAWLARVNLATLGCLIACGLRIVDGFGAPGSGPKGQDAGMILVIGFGIVWSALANAICGTAVLRAQQAGVAAWYRAHPIGGYALTAVATAPILVVQGIVTVAIVTVVMLLAGALQR